MTLRLNQTSTNRISRRGQVPNSNHHSLLDGTAGLTRLQVQQKTANRISWNNNVYIYIYLFFLDFNCQTVLKPIYIIQIIIYHDLSSLKFIYTHLHLRFHTASAGASTPTASFTRLERASSLEKQQPTKNKPLSDWNTQLKQHYVRKNGSCLWGVNYMGLVSIPYGDETQLDFYHFHVQYVAGG